MLVLLKLYPLLGNHGDMIISIFSNFDFAMHRYIFLFVAGNPEKGFWYGSLLDLGNHSLKVVLNGYLG